MACSSHLIPRNVAAGQELVPEVVSSSPELRDVTNGRFKPLEVGQDTVISARVMLSSSPTPRQAKVTRSD